jgi:hypothetical protein
MNTTAELGPLAQLLGVWEGEKGNDLAPSDKPHNNRQPVTSAYRERMVFEPTGRVDNHEQSLYGLRYRTTAWRIGAPDPFHEEVGYWMYDAKTGVLLRSFMPPRGMTVLAGGTAAADAKRFQLEARAGDPVWGICSSPFLTAEFKTERYTLEVEHLGPDSFRYESHTWMRMKGREQLFDHLDANTMHRAK